MITFTICVGQVSGSNWQTAASFTQLNLRAAPYSAAAYNQDSHLGDGVYKFVNVASGEYKLFNGSTELTKFGIIKIGEDGAMLRSGGTMSGAINMNGNDLTSVNTFSVNGLASFNNNTLFSDTVSVDDTLLADNIVVNSGGAVVINDEADSPLEAPNLGQVEELIASAITGFFPHNTNEVVVMGGAETVAGKVYSSLDDASEYLNSLSLTSQKRGSIYVMTHRTMPFYPAEPVTLRDYINIKGVQPAHLNTTSDFLNWDNLGTIIVIKEHGTKRMTFSDCTLIFGNSAAETYGNGNQTGARAYANMTFSNVIIYAYNDTTFNNCILNNTEVIHSGSFKSSFTGTTQVKSCRFNNTPVDSSTYNGNNYFCGYTVNIPADVTAYIPS